MGNGDYCSLPPVLYTPANANVSLPDGSAAVAPPPAAAPPPKAAPKTKDTFTKKVEVKANKAEANVCTFDPPPAKAAPAKPTYDPAKLDKRAKIYEGTINAWAKDHKVYKEGDGAAMWLMDKAFGSKANAVYDQQEKDLKAMYGQYKKFMAEGHYEAASKQLDYIVDVALPKFRSLAAKANEGSISNAEAAKKGAEITAAGAGVVFVAAGAVVAAPAAAAAGAYGAAVSGSAAFGFATEVAVTAGAVGAMNGARVAVTDGTVAAVDGKGVKGVAGAAANGAGKGFVDGAKAGAGGAVAGKVLAALPVVGHGAHHVIDGMAKGGDVTLKGAAALGGEQAIKYGVVKPVAGGAAHVIAGDSKKK